jgi:Peptidase_C39 like family
MDYEAVAGGLADAAPEVVPQVPDVSFDVPASLNMLSDGHPTVVIGDVSGYVDFNHPQGDNPYGFQSTCGLCSCGDILDQFGVNVTEADIVDHAVQNHECNITNDPEQSGGTSPENQVQILNDYGVPAHMEQSQSLEDLATDVEQGHGVIIEANAGYLWNQPQYLENGQSNHAVIVTGVARDPNTGEIQGFYVNDSGDGQAAKFIDANTMTNAWVNTGGTAVVTDVAHTGSAAVPV